jgi:hypothetical protein
MQLSFGDFSEKLLRAAYALLFVATPPLSVFAPRAMALMLVVAGVLALPSLWVQRIKAVQLLYRLRYWLLAAAALLVWGALGISPLMHILEKIYLPTLGYLLAAIALWNGVGVLTATQAKKLWRWMVAGFVLAALLFAIEWLGKMPINSFINELKDKGRPHSYDLDRGLVLISFMVWPLLLGLAYTCKAISVVRWVMWIVPPLMAYLVGHTMSQASMVGLVISYLAFICWQIFPRVTPYFMQAGILAGFMTAPLVALWLEQMFGTDRSLCPDASAGDRIAIWIDTVGHILQRPLTGYGFEAVRFFEGLGAYRGHPHSAPLQLWVELGVVGPLVVALALAAIVRNVCAMSPRHEDAWGQRLMLASVAGWVLVSSVSYGIWQGWWMATMVTIPLMFAIVRRMRVTPPA